MSQFHSSILALSAASFLYSGLADLVPWFHRQIGGETGLAQLLLILAGIGTVLLLRTQWLAVWYKLYDGPRNGVLSEFMDGI